MITPQITVDPRVSKAYKINHDTLSRWVHGLGVPCPLTISPLEAILEDPDAPADSIDFAYSADELGMTRNWGDPTTAQCFLNTKLVASVANECLLHESTHVARFLQEGVWDGSRFDWEREQRIGLAQSKIAWILSGESYLAKGNEQVPFRTADKYRHSVHIIVGRHSPATSPVTQRDLRDTVNYAINIADVAGLNVDPLEVIM